MYKNIFNSVNCKNCSVNIEGEQKVNPKFNVETTPSTITKILIKDEKKKKKKEDRKNRDQFIIKWKKMCASEKLSGPFCQEIKNIK